MQIVLDVGSGNTITSFEVAKRVVDEISKVDNGKHEIILKAQLFRDQPPNEHLKKNVFVALWEYGNNHGYKVTASVFDLESLKFLLSFRDLPFIKIACRPELYWLIGEIPRRTSVYVSYKPTLLKAMDMVTQPVIAEALITELLCIPEYPAKIEDYGDALLGYAYVSDHTVGLELLKKWRPEIWEKHFVLKHDDTNPDAGPFAITPEELKEALQL